MSRKGRGAAAASGAAARDGPPQGELTREQSLEEALRIKSMVFDVALTANSIANADGVLTAANGEFLKIWGYAGTHEVLGKSLAHFFMDPGEAATIVEALNEAGQWEGDFTAKRLDSSTFLAHGLASVVRNDQGARIGYQSAVLDITERRRAQEALRASEAKHREFFALAVDGILLGSPDGKIIGANVQMQKLCGRSLEQLLGLHVSDLLDPEELLAKPLRFDLLNARRTVVNERTLLRPDGSRLVTEMHSSRMPDGTYQSIYRDISQRKLAENALRESNELLVRFIRDSPIYSYIKEVTPTVSRVLHASENFQHMVGIPGSSMAGMSMEDLFPTELAAKITADDWNVVSTGETMKVTEEFNGGTYSSIKFPIVQDQRTLLAGYTIDITAQTQTAQAMRTWNQKLERRVEERTVELQQSQDRFRQLAEATFEGIAITENGILLDGNTQLGVMHGYELAEMIGRPVTDFIPPEWHAVVSKAMSEGCETPYELMGLRKDGSIFPLDAHARMRTWRGRHTRVTALRDLTRIKQTAAQLHAQQAALEHAQRLGLLTEISAGIIHQIGQPLSAMGVNLAVLMSRLAACPIHRCGCLEIAEETKADIACMRNVITHMRMLAHPENPHFLPIDFNGLLEGLLPLLQQTALECRIALVVQLERPLPPVLADQIQLNQVVLNLARNAFDASADCPPERRVVTLATRALAGEGVECRVSDLGSGIAPEAMEHLFSPFFTTKAAGMGIGLRLSQTIVEAHGGRIEAANNPDGVGACFRIILPPHSVVSSP